MPSDHGGVTGGVTAPFFGVGVLGNGFMARAHANAFRQVAFLAERPATLPVLSAIAGRDAANVSRAASLLGFTRWTLDWRELIEDPDIQVFDNCGPNALHAEATIAAARAGKHLLCEKPLGRDAGESFAMWEAAEAAGVRHLCGFNYRFVPAIAFARELLASGELGEILHYRARYLQDWGLASGLPAAWRFVRAEAGSGALGDLGSHIVDLGRYLVGEITEVVGTTQTFIPVREGVPVDVDDAFSATVSFDNGALGSLEASRVCPGRKNQLAFEINGTKGSLSFDLERLNELTLYIDRAANRPMSGFRTILVTGPEHPFMRHWWPEGHTIGWEHSFVHEAVHLVSCVIEERSVRPLGADFEDGYRAAVVCDEVLASARTGARRVPRYEQAPLGELAQPIG